MTAADVAAALANARTVAASLERSLAHLGPLFPLDGARLEAFDEATRVATDALLKRFENLVNVLQDQLYRLIAELEVVRVPLAASRRDQFDTLEKLGVLPSADQFLDVARVRNRLSHVYPDKASLRAGQLNRAWAASRVALDALVAAEAWAARRGIAPGGMP